MYLHPGRSTGIPRSAITVYTGVTVNYRFIAGRSIYEEEALSDPDLKKWRPLNNVVIEGNVNGPGTVDVAVDPPAASASHAANRCRWLIDTKATFKTGPCNAPVWLPAVVRDGKWSFTINGPLPVGNYTIESRASNNGSSEAIFDTDHHNRVRLAVLPGHK